MNRLTVLVLAWLALTAAVGVTVLVVPGIDVEWSPGIYWAISAVLALVNVVLGSILRLLALPLVLLTFGLLCVVINAVVLLATAWLLDSVDIDGFWPALVGSVVIALAAAVVEGLLRSVMKVVHPSY